MNHPSPRKRRWKHQLWHEGPLDQKFPPPPASTSKSDSDGDLKASLLDRAKLARPKLFMPDRGICMTPSIRVNGPSYMKPVPRGTSPTQSDEPLIVITRTVANRQLIVARSESAAAMGTKVGMTLTEARALCAGLQHFDEDPAADARAIEALARWMMRFTPVVSLPFSPSTGTSGEGWGGGLHERSSPVQTPLPNPPPKYRGREKYKLFPTDTIYLDLTGCSRVFGGISNIVEKVIDSLRRLRLRANVAVASNPAAAWAVASFGQNGQIAVREDLSCVLSSLPIAGLNFEDELLGSLHHLGLETIGQLMNLPRSALPSRFGPALLRRLDQALGRIDEPLVPLIYQAPIEARMDFDGVVDSIETIYLVFKKLIGEIVAQLSRRDLGAREVQIQFFRAYVQTIEHTIGLSRPSRDPINLFNLIRCAIENLDSDGDGFLGIRLFIPRFERINDEQIALLDHERFAGEIELTQLIERLCVKMGQEVVNQPELVESYIPEHAFTSHGRPARDSKNDSRAGRPCHARPLELLPNPIELAVMVSPSEDRDGRPIFFRMQNDVHNIVHAIGPERISGEWWRGHARTRDYFDVEDEGGKRFWIFRVQETNRWFLHGNFA